MSAPTNLTGGSATINIPAGSLAAGSDTLTVSYTPDSGSPSTYNSATVSSSVSVTLAKTTPTITVTPASPSITTAQALSVTVVVSGTPTPTGSVVLAGGGYTSAATILTSGSATINIPAGSLAIGSDSLTASYTPDAGSSSTYNSGSGNSSVSVTLAKTTPAMTVTPASPQHHDRAGALRNRRCHRNSCAYRLDHPDWRWLLVHSNDPDRR